MTKQEHVALICYKFSALALMDAANLERRIKRLALGKTNPEQLAATLLKVKQGAEIAPNAPEDEQIWGAAMVEMMNRAGAIPKAKSLETQAAKKPEAK
jgi:hypothetical protein